MDVERGTVELKGGSVSRDGAIEANNTGKKAQKIEDRGIIAKNAMGLSQHGIGLEQAGSFTDVASINPGKSLHCCTDHTDAGY